MDSGASLRRIDSLTLPLLISGDGMGSRAGINAVKIKCWILQILELRAVVL
jgi:hypothetical protein